MEQEVDDHLQQQEEEQQQHAALAVSSGPIMPALPSWSSSSSLSRKTTTTIVTASSRRIVMPSGGGGGSNVGAARQRAPGLEVFGLPWIEKYRPTSLSDIVGNQHAVTYLEALARQGNMPNLLLAGPPGTGKTTSIACLARTLLGAAADDAVLELNASDDRGIEVVRKTIKRFATKSITLPPGQHKVIILDEADYLTSAAQQALRCTMEKYTNTTRFALACNTSSMVIEALQSRCAILRYVRLTDAQILDRLCQIASAEEVRALAAVMVVVVTSRLILVSRIVAVAIFLLLSYYYY
jgi:replication factor C subunit 2/4